MCAYQLGAERVISIDHIPERLEKAHQIAGAEALNYEGMDVVETLKEWTGGRGPDVCIDAVGMEAHGAALDSIMDRAMQVVGMTTDRPHVLREAIQACKKGGVLSIPGVYGGFLDKIPFGAAFGKGLKFRMGQTHVHRYLPELMAWIQNGRLDPSVIISHTLPLDDAPYGYDLFKARAEGVTKIVLKP
jgi:threonine dehydrogenase-like Zn-dependent dehydrogenase